MGQPQDSDAKRFYRVAFQRFDDSESLLAAERTNGAQYLAGYSVECMLKALLLQRTLHAERDTIEGFFQGSVGHNLEELKLALSRKGENFPRRNSIAYNFQQVVRFWSTNLRYEPGLVRRREAEEFLNSVRGILLWIDNRI